MVFHLAFEMTSRGYDGISDLRNRSFWIVGDDIVVSQIEVQLLMATLCYQNYLIVWLCAESDSCF